MKVLSLWQPWASAIALGAKRIETRSWATPYRGPLLIHAARTTAPGLEDLRVRSGLWNEVLAPQAPMTLQTAFRTLPFGALVARCELVDCVATADVETIRAVARSTGEKYTHLERELGNYERGRWAWMLRNVQPLRKPIPMRGGQGLFEVEVAGPLAEVG